jgi:hypothetical protein
MTADCKGSLGSVLVMAHPVEIAVQKGLIDLLPQQGIQKTRLPKIGEETIYRVAQTTEVSFQCSPMPARQRISPEEALHFS